MLTNADGIGIFHLGTTLEGDPETGLMRAGRHVRLRARFENPLVSGRYFFHLSVSRGGQGAGTALYVHNAVDFVVFGNEQPDGMVTLGHEIEAVFEEAEEP